jgi:hypothetical protein
MDFAFADEFSKFKLPNNYSGKYQQSRLIKSIGVTLKSSGTITVKDSSVLLWKQLIPFENVIKISNDSLYSGKEGTLKKDNSVFAKYISQLVFRIFRGDTKKLKEQFKVSLGRGVLTLHPKNELMAKAIKSVVVKGTEQIEEVILTELSGNVMHIIFLQN